ncbi:MAG: NAD(P)-dependent oxidoreductase [Phycisphaerae bacterium]|nr:NAD(P)-dependent oxidoreductase [Phycisphaerae bacterium]
MDEIAVIGANGFVGRHLCLALARAGAKVYGYDLADAPAVRHEQFQYNRLDILADPPRLPEACTSLIYLSQSPFYREFPEKAEHLFGVNAWGPCRAAEAFLQTPGRLFLYASTGNVYAPAFGPLNESAPTRRDDAYALSKLGGEDVMRLLDAKVADRRFVSLRFFGLFGPSQRTMLPVALFRRIWNDEPITLQPRPDDPSDAGGLRVSWLYIHDLTAILASLLTRQVSPESIPPCLNVAGDQAVPLREFAEHLGRAVGKSPRWQIAESARPGDLAADVTRLRQLGQPAYTPLPRAVEETARELRAWMESSPPA